MDRLIQLLLDTTTLLAGGAIILLVIALTVWHLLRQKHKTTSLTREKLSEQAKADLILNSINDGVMVVSLKGIIQAFNPAAGRITGWQPDETISLDHPLVMKLLDAQGQVVGDDINPLNKVFLTKQPVVDDDLTLVTKNNRRLSVSLSVSPIADASGHINTAAVIFRDITKEKLEQQQRSEFISTASHEMRTPIATIEGYLALAMNPDVSKVDEKTRGLLTKAHEATTHLGQLFQDLLTTSQADDNRLPSHPKVTEMGSLLERIAEDLRFGAEKKGLKMEFVIGVPEIARSDGGGSKNIIRPLYYTEVDPDRIREVIGNLFDNALKYTETGKISIGITGNDKVVQLWISDTGTGIPSEDIPHLFQRFYRVDSSETRAVGGTGLGLYICRKILELYHGRIWVESTVGKGSTFYINLPRISTDQAARAMAQQAVTKPSNRSKVIS